MEENTISLNSPKAWFLAARPKTLTGAAVPVMIGLSLAYSEIGSVSADLKSAATFSWLPAVLCFLFAFIMQIDANFVNDYYDFKKGNDDETRLGPRRACAQGWVSPSAMLKAMALTTAVACLIGLPLVLYGGMEMILVGAVCVLFCFLYTTRLSYVGLGDVLVLVFFGIVPVCVTCYIQTGHVTPRVFVASLACGFAIDALLLVNNYRDIDNDTRAGKRTLVVRIGAQGGRLAYLFTGVLATLLGAFTLLNCERPVMLLPLLYFVFHFITYRHMVKINKGKALNKVLGETARNIFIYGVVMSCGFILLNA